jgi:type II secretory pathway pseudopilin PulG
MVELLVGILMLAVIAVPLVRAFVTSAKTSEKAREIRNQTLAAQNVIESYKAAGIGAILTDLAGHDDTLGTMAVITGLDTLVVNPDGSKSYEQVPPADYGAVPADGAGYRLYLTGVAGGSKSYDAILYLDATKFQQNDTPIVDYKPMDAVYAQPDPDNDPLDNPDIIAAKDFASQATIDRGMEVPYTDFYNKLMNRTVTVTLRKLPSGIDEGVISCAVTFGYYAVYQYFISNPDESPAPSPQLVTRQYSTEISYDFYSGSYSADTVGISGLYFFYYPNTTDASGDTDDRIELINRDNIPTSIYLIRQGNDDPAYKTAVNLRERYSGAVSEKAQLYSNMTCSFKVYMGYPISGGGYSDYWFNTGAFDGALVGTPAQNRLYEIKIDLFKSGAGFAGNALSTFDASTLE